MANSSSTNFELDVAEYIEEAFERCGLEARTGYDLQTARRSMNIMLAEWANRGLNQWTIEQRTQALTADSTEYSLGTDIIDVLSCKIFDLLSLVHLPCFNPLMNEPFSIMLSPIFLM